jgi:hypothetical protein
VTVGGVECRDRGDVRGRGFLFGRVLGWSMTFVWLHED